MAEDIRLPELGENIAGGKVLRVLVQAGDTIEKEQPLIEIESDKATAEIPATRAGTVQEVYVQEGTTLSVGDPYLSLQPAEATADAAEEEQEAQPTKDAKQEPAKQDATKEASEEGKESTPAKGGTSVEVRLPELGENISEGTVVGLLAKQGDTVKAGANLLEIETGKATLEVPTETGGTLEEFRVAEGDTVTVGNVIAVIKTKASKTGELPAHAPEAVHTPGSTTAAKEKSDDESPAPEDDPLRRVGLVMATPGVRRLARELGLEIHAVQGTGPGGRITEDDVKAAARALILRQGGRETQNANGEGERFDDFGPVERKPINGIRKATAATMAQSWATVPLVTQFDEADFTLFEEARARLREIHSVKIGPTTMLAKIVATALKVHPKLQARLDLDLEEEVYRGYVNLGIAVETPRGLLVPVLRDVTHKGLRAVNDSLTDLASRAREGKLKPAEMRGGGFTITNLGGLGGKHFTPLVLPPQVAILGVGRARMQPVYQDGAFVPRLLCPLSLSYDHRLVDGADGTRFLRWLVGAIENPLLTLMEEGDD